MVTRKEASIRVAKKRFLRSKGLKFNPSISNTRLNKLVKMFDRSLPSFTKDAKKLFPKAFKK